MFRKKWTLKKINSVEEIKSLHLVHALQSENAGHKQTEANELPGFLVKCTPLFISITCYSASYIYMLDLVIKSDAKLMSQVTKDALRVGKYLWLE